MALFSVLQLNNSDVETKIKLQVFIIKHSKKTPL